MHRDVSYTIVPIRAYNRALNPLNSSQESLYEHIQHAMEEGLCEDVTDFHKLIQKGQYCYYSEVAQRALHEIYEEHMEA